MPPFEIKAVVKQAIPMHEDFEEIAHTGGKIQITTDGTIGMSQLSDHRSAWFVIRSSYNGFPLQHVPMVGMGMNFPPGPYPSVLVFIGSDREGFFGRKCRSCNEYFRTTRPSDPCCCPYCGNVDTSLSYMTEAQLQYINAYADEYYRMLRTKQDITIDLDEIAKRLQDNRSHLYYTENRQQTLTKCDNCNCEFDIIGLYGFCPSCQKRNSLQIFIREISHIKERIDKPRYPETEREKREAEWKDVVAAIVSTFDGFAGDINKQLLRLPCTPKRRKETSEISYQNISNAQPKLLELWGIDLFKGMSTEDKEFLLKMLQKRHLFVHRSGVVDQEYIDRSHDHSVRIGRKIRIRSSEATRLISVILVAGNNLYLEYESFFADEAKQKA
jgi:hypothetical protein